MGYRRKFRGSTAAALAGRIAGSTRTRLKSANIASKRPTGIKEYFAFPPVATRTGSIATFRRRPANPLALSLGGAQRLQVRPGGQIAVYGPVVRYARILGNMAFSHLAAPEGEFNPPSADGRAVLPSFLNFHPVGEEVNGPPPMRDQGVFLGWDDEDVLVSQNRMTGINPDGTLPPEAPSGVGGYRVDVRLRDGADWHSLCRVKGEVLALGPVDLGNFSGEREVEVHPRRLKERFCLPIFARWRGMSLVVTTEEDRPHSAAGPSAANDRCMRVGLGIELAENLLVVFVDPEVFIFDKDDVKVKGSRIPFD